MDDDSEITQLHWNVFMKTFYLDSELNANRIVQMLGNYSPEEMSQLLEFGERVTRVFSQARSLDARVFIDAE